MSATKTPSCLQQLSPDVCKYKVHKLNQWYILSLCGGICVMYFKRELTPLCVDTGGLLWALFSDSCVAVCSFPMVPLNISVSTCINNACFQQLNASSFVDGFCLKKERSLYIYIYILPLSNTCGQFPSPTLLDVETRMRD